MKYRPREEHGGRAAGPETPRKDDLDEAPAFGGRSLRDTVETHGPDITRNVLGQLVEGLFADSLPDDVAVVFHPEVQRALAVFVEHRGYGVDCLGGLRGGELVLNVFRFRTEVHHGRASIYVDDMLRSSATRRDVAWRHSIMSHGDTERCRIATRSDVA